MQRMGALRQRASIDLIQSGRLPGETAVCAEIGQDANEGARSRTIEAGLK